MAHNVSIKRADTNAFVQMVCSVIHTKRAAFQIKVVNHINVAEIKNAPTHWPAFREHVLVHAKAYCVDRMRIVNQKIMLPGVDAALALLKTNMANVFHVCYFISFFYFWKK